MIGGPSELALATGRDFNEDGMGDEEKLCMPSFPSESSFAGDNLDEAEQVAAAQLTTGGSTIVTRSMARRASGAQPGTQDEGSPMISITDAFFFTRHVLLALNSHLQCCAKIRS